MGKLFYGFCLASLIVIALAGQSPVPNFAGTWTLDKGKSVDLGSVYKFFERTTWVITQTNKEISIKETFSSPVVKKRPESRPVTVLGAGGGDTPIGPRIYTFDGRETIKDIGRSKYARKAILSTDGQTLELIEKITAPGTDGEVTTTSSDKLSLSADGQVLTVVRKRDGPGPQNSTLVFTK